jgi:PAS domain S-box-containing protein
LATASSSGLFENTFENAAVGLGHAALDGRFLRVNAYLCDLVGYTKSELMQRTFADITHPDDLEEDWSLARGLVTSNQQSYSLHKRYLHKNGRVVWVALHVVLIRRPDGEPDYFLSTVTDISEQKEAEFDLAQRNRQLQLVFDRAELADWCWDIQRDLVFAHPMLFRQYGEPSASGPLPSAWFTQRQHTDDSGFVAATLQTALKNESRFEVEFRVIHPDSSIHWLSCRATIIRNANGQPIRTEGVSLDVTPRKQAEEAAQASNRQLLTLTEVLPQILWFAANDGDVLFYNLHWYEYTGQHPDDARNWGWTPVLHPDDFERCMERWKQSLETGEIYEIEYRLRRADGVYRWHLGQAVPYRDESGQIVRWFGSCTDIHEQKTEQDRLEAEVQIRTEALRRSLLERETLLKEVHHRVKNNLQVISSLLRMQAELLSDRRAAAALKDGERRVLAMSLIHEWLYRDQHMDSVNFGQYAQTLVTEIFRATGARSRNIAHRLEMADVRLTVDRAIPCGLILNELVTNVIKYAYAPGSSGDVVIRLQEQPSGVIRLVVADSGVGLPPDFDLQGTKSLGLQIVSILTRQIAGDLRVDTSAGTSFVLEFPRGQRPAR